jgi:hypothetical protein
MRGPRPFRMFLMGILALTSLAQAFWFVCAWRLINAVAWLRATRAAEPCPCRVDRDNGALSIEGIEPRLHPHLRYVKRVL